MKGIALTRQTSTFVPINGTLDDEHDQTTACRSRLPEDAHPPPSLPRRVEGNGLGLTKRRLQTMEQIAREALEDLPLIPSPPDVASERSLCLPIPLKRGRAGTEDFLYIEVIARLPQRPKEPDHGFVEEDLIRLVQVYVFKRVRTRICGQGFPLEALLHELTDASLRDRIIARTAAMMEALNPDDDFFDEANRRLIASGCGVFYWQH